jgi:AcrR family transcriptional regulator
MPRAGLDAGAVVAAAAELADAEGLPALTLTRLAARLGVRTPSLYAHVDGLEDLRRRVAQRGAIELGDVLAGAASGLAGRDALVSVAGAYRRWAHAFPGRYAALQRAGDADQASAARVVRVVLAVLRGYGLDGDGLIHGARVVRSSLHGFVSLEAGGGFGLPLGLDESFAWLLETLDRGLRA